MQWFNILSLALPGARRVHGRQQPIHHQECEGPSEGGRCSDTSGVRKRSKKASIGQRLNAHFTALRCILQ